MSDKEINELVDLFFPFDWDKKNYAFNRDEKDMHPYSIQTTDKEVIITHNVLGINKEDLVITLETIDGKTYMKINGQTDDQVTNKKYSVHSQFLVNPTEWDITRIQSSVKNGLLYIIIPQKQKPKVENIKIDIL